MSKEYFHVSFHLGTSYNSKKAEELAALAPKLLEVTAAVQMQVQHEDHGNGGVKLHDSSCTAEGVILSPA